MPVIEAGSPPGGVRTGFGEPASKGMLAVVDEPTYEPDSSNGATDCRRGIGVAKTKGGSGRPDPAAGAPSGAR
jgi:hypothetical protein